MRLLIFGDVVGKLGRAGVKHMLPVWRKKYSPDVVVANVENILHGKGIGPLQLQELRDAGVDVFTGGNHSVEGKDVEKILNDENYPITRPANMRADLPGRGVILYDVKNKKVSLGETAEQKAQLLVINLIGQVFMHQEYASPFETIDKILEEHGGKTPFIILDWHADATSEKSVMGWYLDGKVSAVLGTHTHVPTADAKILPKGTAYISDIGMAGAYNSVIGVEVEPSIERFKKNIKNQKNPPESGPIEVNAVYLELEERGAVHGDSRAVYSEAARAVDIRHLREIVIEYRI
ncbi:MAG: TIGR00282 family metallophosphoesterase [bacterium]|nr:TIGR00282 family metallophosphoesterase [bacterium]